MEEEEGEQTFLVLSELQLLQWKQPLQFLLFMNLHRGHLTKLTVVRTKVAVKKRIFIGEGHLQR